MQCCIQGQPELGKGRASCSYLVLVHIFISRDDDALLYPGLGEPSFHSLCEEKESSHPCPRASSRQGNSAMGAGTAPASPQELPLNSAELPLPLTQGEVWHTAAPTGEGEGLGQVPCTLLMLSSPTELLLSL